MSETSLLRVALYYVNQSLMKLTALSDRLEPQNRNVSLSACLHAED